MIELTEAYKASLREAANYVQVFERKIPDPIELSKNSAKFEKGCFDCGSTHIPGSLSSSGLYSTMYFYDFEPWNDEDEGEGDIGEFLFSVTVSKLDKFWQNPSHDGWFKHLFSAGHHAGSHVSEVTTWSEMQSMPFHPYVRLIYVPTAETTVTHINKKINFQTLGESLVPENQSLYVYSINSAGYEGYYCDPMHDPYNNPTTLNSFYFAQKNTAIAISQFFGGGLSDTISGPSLTRIEPSPRKGARFDAKPLSSYDLIQNFTNEVQNTTYSIPIPWSTISINSNPSPS